MPCHLKAAQGYQGREIRAEWIANDEMYDLFLLSARGIVTVGSVHAADEGSQSSTTATSREDLLCANVIYVPDPIQGNVDGIDRGVKCIRK